MVLHHFKLRNRYIIIGQGIAGSMLAWQLLKNKQKVIVVDNGHKTSASKIAAGMWNPILFKKLKKSWRADELLPALLRTYSELENELGITFMHEREIVRLFPSNDSANDFHLKVDDENYSKYLTDKPQKAIEEIAKDKFGYGTVNGGYIDLPVFLPAFRAYLEEKKSFIQTEFDENEVEFLDDGISWNGYKADKLIYANGYKTIESKYWNHLPLSRTHGNLLHVKIPEFQLNNVFNNGQWLLHQEDGTYKMGATFEWDLTEPTPSEESKQKLISKLESGLKEKPNLNLVKHHAGIRPTTSDHRPLLGLHPEHPQLGIFNGMGTKGVMLVPFFAVQMTDYLLSDSQLDDDVNLKRFIKTND